MESTNHCPKSKLSVWQLIKSDVDRYDATEHCGWLAALLFCPGCFAGIVYRIGHWIWITSNLPLPVKTILKVLYMPLMRIVEITTGISLVPGATFGPGLYIGHFGGIRVGVNVVAGSNCNLSPGVVLGGIYSGRKMGHPHIGDRVYIAPGAKVIGHITVGNDVSIGANSVVGRDVPDRSVVIGVPARTVSGEGSFDYVVYRGMENDPERAASLALVHTAKDAEA